MAAEAAGLNSDFFTSDYACEVLYFAWVPNEFHHIFSNHLSCVSASFRIPVLFLSFLELVVTCRLNKCTFHSIVWVINKIIE